MTQAHNAQVLLDEVESGWRAELTTHWGGKLRGAVVSAPTRDEVMGRRCSNCGHRERSLSPYVTVEIQWEGRDFTGPAKESIWFSQVRRFPDDGEVDCFLTRVSDTAYDGEAVLFLEKPSEGDE